MLSPVAAPPPEPARIRPHLRRQVGASTRPATRVARMARALADDTLGLVYQPIVHLADGRTHGVEALLRWVDPEEGPVPAPEAIAAADEAGLLGPLGEWVLRRALDDLVLWRALPAGRHLTVNVNVSAQQLQGRGLTRTINRQLALHDLPADALVLELTETEQLPPGAGRTVARLADLGVPLSVDDVGTGHASAMRVQGLPVREMKLEIDLLGRRSEGGGTFGGLVRRAVGSGLRTIVERIETPDHLLAALDAGCTHGQGWLLGRPLGAEDLTRHLASWRPPGS